MKLAENSNSKETTKKQLDWIEQFSSSPFRTESESWKRVLSAAFNFISSSLEWKWVKRSLPAASCNLFPSAEFVKTLEMMFIESSLEKENMD